MGYTEKHFESNTLFIVYAEADSSDSDFKIEFLTNSRETLTMRIMEFASNNPDNKRTGYFILVDVMNEHIENTKLTDAVLSSTIYPEQYITDRQIIRTYTFEDSQQEIFKPNFSLYEDGRFVFNFSPFSSYFATGKYTVEEGKIILRTNDGRYTYCFNEQNDTYVFDASSSSDTLFTDISDGAIFY